ncbi:UDP-glycosyltransferase 83A1-like [Cicer arietinum]|uniref:UDP-glycosyltransferase 83A1-like n=1 Tax=Cicer arietinum TaxID=3827 RepID=UPI00032A9B45
MGNLPHFLAIPFQVQGHVNPLMQFSQILTKYGCKVTFLHTEFNHKRSNMDDCQNNKIKVVTLSDGLESEDDRSDTKKVMLSIKSTMPNKLPKLIEDINALEVDNNNKINCIVVTFSMGWALEVGHKLGIKGALLFPASATSLACVVCIPRLIEDGIIDSEGNPTKQQEIQISPDIPMMDTTNLPWHGTDKILFDYIVQEIQTINLAEWWLCNTSYNLDLLNKPFLWIVRPNNDNIVSYEYPDEFLGTQGKIVGWAPQKKILNHPATACFISHCGWNSTIEGVHAGVPFICWPFLTDQFLNKSYICDVWKNGLALEKDENGFISKEEIKRKVEQVLDDDDIKEMCLKIKEMTINNMVEGGESSNNLQKFISWVN